MALALLAAAALFGAAAEGTLLHQPRATGTPVLPLDGITPLETPAPDLRRAKARRAVESTTVFLAPDNTCGYVDGKQNVIFSCNDKFAQCAITSNTGTGYIGCCDAGSCGGYHTLCIDREAYDETGCGDKCNDAQVLLCTNTGGAFCNTITINADAFNVWAYYCAGSEATEIQNVETTYSGETDDRSFTRTVVFVTNTDSTTSTATDSTNTDTAGAPTNSDTETDTATSTTSVAPTDTTTTTTPTVPTTPAGSSGTASPAAGGEKKKSNAGPIAGGVVGGVGGAALLAAVAALLFRQHKKKAAAKEAAAAAAGAGAAGAAGAAAGGGPATGPTPPPMTQTGGYAAVPQQPPYYSGQSPAPSAGYPYYGGAAAAAAVPAEVAGSPAPDRTDSTSPLQPSPTPGSQDYARMSTVSAASTSPYVGGAAAAVQPTIYEAGGSPVGADGGFHHGTMHELA